MTNNLTPKMTMLLQFGLLTLVYSSPNAKIRERGTLLSTPLFPGYKDKRKTHHPLKLKALF